MGKGGGLSAPGDVSGFFVHFHVGSEHFEMDKGIAAGSYVLGVLPERLRPDVLSSIEAKVFHAALEQLVHVLRVLAQDVVCRLQIATQKVAPNLESVLVIPVLGPALLPVGGGETNKHAILISE